MYDQNDVFYNFFFIIFFPSIFRQPKIFRENEAKVYNTFVAKDFP